jgi:hypothetical protein
MTDQRILFVHIPKTAGMSLFYALQKNIGKDRSLRFEYGGSIDSKKYDALSKLDLEKLHLLSGHFYLSSFLTKDLSGWKSITILRDPIDREISIYYYVKGWEKHPLYKQFCNMSFDEYTLWRSQLQDGPDEQCRFICGVPDSEKALEWVEKKFYLVGCAEYYQEFVKQLWRMLGWKWSDDSILYANKTSKRPLLLDISNEARHRIESYTVQDRKLFNAIRDKWQGMVTT